MKRNDGRKKVKNKTKKTTDEVNIVTKKNKK